MDDTPPPRLYKYCAPARSDFFKTRRLRFTQPAALNDPFELRPHLEAYGTPEEEREIAGRHWELGVRRLYDQLVQEHGELLTFAEYRARLEPLRERDIDRRIQAHHDDPVARAEMTKTVYELVQNIGVLSLCGAPDDLLMWAHYGDSHKGFVIEFDTASPFFHQTQPPAHVRFTEEDAAKFREEYGRLRRVTYIRERPSMIATRANFEILFCKGEPWSYEAEWRMLMPPEYADATPATCPAGHPISLFELPAQAVTRIVLGFNANAALIDQALQLRQSDETCHIGVERARIDDRHYKLHFEPL
jgi:hypothetical protein